MKDYYPRTRETIDKYNQISEAIRTDPSEINNDDEEFMMNFCLYLAHALIADTGGGDLALEELGKVADIINDVVV